MYSTTDDCIRVNVIKDISEATFSIADVAVMPVPEKKEDFSHMMKSLYESKIDKQILFLLPRGKKSQRLKMISNISSYESWKFIDQICVTYDRPGQSNGNCLVQLSEFGFLFYKGVKTPDLSNTKWFRDSYANSGNHWDLGATAGEVSQQTFFHKFSGEMILLLLKLACPLQSGRVIWGLEETDDSMIHFIYSNQIPFDIYVKTNEQAQYIIQKYEELVVARGVKIK